MGLSPRLARRLCSCLALTALGAVAAACPLLPDASLREGTGGAAATSSTSTSSSTSSTSTSSSTSSTSSSGAGGAAPNACLNPSDEAVLNTLSLGPFFTSVQGCALTNIQYVPPGVKEPATRDCIQNATKVDGGPGLSYDCVTCFDRYANCAIASCAFQCNPPSKATCTPCLSANCSPAFDSCSGLIAP